MAEEDRIVGIAAVVEAKELEIVVDVPPVNTAGRKGIYSGLVGNFIDD